MEGGTEGNGRIQGFKGFHVDEGIWAKWCRDEGTDEKGHMKGGTGGDSCEGNAAHGHCFDVVMMHCWVSHEGRSKW